MSKATAENAVKVLVDNFKRHFPADGMKKIWPELLKHSPKAIESAVDFIVLKHSYLPSPAQFLEKVENESKLIAAKESRQREIEWAETKGGETRKDLDRQGSILNSEQQDAHARHAIQAIRLMFSSSPREDKIECFRAMDQQYPGLGWALQGMKLQKDLERNDKRPHWRDVSDASPQFQLNYQRGMERKR